MICVSIGRGRHKMLLAEHAHAARMGAELVELRIDAAVLHPKRGEGDVATCTSYGDSAIQ